MQKHPFHKRLGVDLKKYGDVKKKIIKKPSENIKNLQKTLSAELDDLTRLHYLIITRKVVTIMEFGVGKVQLFSITLYNKTKAKTKNMSANI